MPDENRPLTDDELRQLASRCDPDAVKAANELTRHRVQCALSGLRSRLQKLSD